MHYKNIYFIISLHCLFSFLNIYGTASTRRTVEITTEPTTRAEASHYIQDMENSRDQLFHNYSHYLTDFFRNLFCS